MIILSTDNHLYQTGTEEPFLEIKKNPEFTKTGFFT